MLSILFHTYKGFLPLFFPHRLFPGDSLFFSKSSTISYAVSLSVGSPCHTPRPMMKLRPYSSHEEKVFERSICRYLHDMPHLIFTDIIAKICPTSQVHQTHQIPSDDTLRHLPGRTPAVLLHFLCNQTNIFHLVISSWRDIGLIHHLGRKP